MDPKNREWRFQDKVQIKAGFYRDAIGYLYKHLYDGIYRIDIGPDLINEDENNFRLLT